MKKFLLYGLIYLQISLQVMAAEIPIQIIRLGGYEARSATLTCRNRFSAARYDTTVPAIDQTCAFEQFWTPTNSPLILPNHFESLVNVVGPNGKLLYCGIVCMKHAQPNDPLKLLINERGESVTVQAIGQSTPDER